MSNQWAPDSIFEVLADEKARQILVATNDAPHSVKDLAKSCDGSLSAIYRRVAVLDDYEFITADTKIDPEGSHYRVFESKISEVNIEIEQAEIAVNLSDINHIEKWQKFIE